MLDGGGTDRAGSMVGHRSAGDRPVDPRGPNHAATVAARAGATAAGETDAAVNDGRSRHGTAALRDHTQLSSHQLVATSSASQGGGTYPGLAADVRSAVNSNAVLSPAQLATLSASDQQQILAARQTVALRQSLAQEALANSSARFAAIQSLIAAISTADDQKAILDLQARISAELGMLQNEQTKLQVLALASQAQESADAQREREQAIAGQGRFESRFQPTP